MIVGNLINEKVAIVFLDFVTSKLDKTVSTVTPKFLFFLKSAHFKRRALYFSIFMTHYDQSRLDTYSGRQFISCSTQDI